MAKCENCGKKFNEVDAEEYFEMETCLEYSRLAKCLCGKCAVQAIEDDDEGVYFETCERCGKTFDLAAEKAEFSSHFSWFDGLSLTSFNEYLCADCALEEVDNLDNEYEDDGYDWGSDDDMPPYCMDCGNSNIYPDCRESCDRFDD